MSITTRCATVAVAVALAGSLAACGATPAPPATNTTTTAQTPAPSGTRTTTPPPKTTNPVKTTTPGHPAPVPGTTFSGEGMSAHDAADLQEAVDQGHQPWRADAAAVSTTFVLSRFGWQNPDVQLADPHTAEVTNPADGRIVSLQLRQPAREGNGGIWVVEGGVWIK